MKKIKGLSILALSAIIIFTACTSQTNAANTSDLVKEVSNVDNMSTTSSSDSSNNIATNSTTSSDSLDKILSEKITYTESDEYTNWKNESYTSITLNNQNADIKGDGAALDNGTINITKGGTYVLSGTFKGFILVNAPKTEDVRIVLNNAEISSDTTAPIQVYQANKVILTIEENTQNTLTDKALTTLSKNKDKDEITATIYSTTDLIINGKGSLTVNANTKNGIVSKKNLILLSGKINVTAADDAIVGKDSLQIKEADITSSAKGDGIKSNNETDEGKGYLIVSGGNIKISSGDDALKGEKQLIITGGNIDITESVEGIESMELILAGGNIKVKSSDDAINAAGGDINNLTILGGNIALDAEGDGVDSNGDITMSGGTLTVYGPTNSGNGGLDYDGTFNISGGVLNVAGSAGMAVTPSESSTQNTISYTFDSIQNANTKVELKNQSGKTIASITSTKQFQNVIFSSADIKTNESYSIYANNQKITDVKVQGSLTYGDAGYGNSQGGPGRVPSNFGQNQMPPMQDGQRQRPPRNFNGK